MNPTLSSTCPSLPNPWIKFSPETGSPGTDPAFNLDPGPLQRLQPVVCGFSRGVLVIDQTPLSSLPSGHFADPHTWHRVGWGNLLLVLPSKHWSREEVGLEGAFCLLESSFPPPLPSAPQHNRSSLQRRTQHQGQRGQGLLPATHHGNKGQLTLDSWAHS